MAQIYGFDPAWEGERDRMALAESVLDEVTTGHLERLGVDNGWRCLEVGAGAGSIARWLTRRVGTGGRVLATDLDTRFTETLGGLGEPGLEVRRHDIVAGPPFDEAFDLAHTRLVLQHLAGREQAITHMVDALAPGGWLLAEEFDFVSSMAAGSPDAPRATVFAQVEWAIHEVLAETGFDPACGRRLPGLLRGAGLVDVEATGALSVLPGGSPLAEWYGLSIAALRPRLVAAGLVSEAYVDRVIADLADPAFELVTPVLISARGRKPVPVAR